MKLQIGERLSGSGPPQQPGGYVVTGVVRESPWCGLYAGKKIFYNFDFTQKRPRETDEKEWLDVYLRTLHYPRLDDAGYVARRRAQARAESRRILSSRGSNLWPEPVDVLEIANTRDSFTFPVSTRDGDGDLEPILVFARPQGLLLDDWRNTIVPLASLLGVLAELLDFLRCVHDEGLLLNGLHPGAVVVDRAERVHYIGSDMVVAGGEEAWVSDAERTRFFPAERYAPGYTCPGVLQGRVPMRRSDLYAWGWMVYAALAGESPDKIAREQGQSFSIFQEHHGAKLKEVLKQVPSPLVRTWGDQLGIDGAALAADWPDNVLAVWRLLLSPQPFQRPDSVAELRAWLLNPPPAAVQGALAVREGTGPVKLWLDVSTLAPDDELIVRRGAPAPQEAGAGQLVMEGSPRSPIEDPSAPRGAVHYGVFTRKRRREAWAFSRPLITEPIEPTPGQLLKLAEAGLPGDGADQPESPQVALLFQAINPLDAAEAMYASALPAVRCWAVRRVADVPEPAPRGEALLWRALRDATPTVRLIAAKGLLREPRPPLERLRRVAETSAEGNLDAAIQAARTLSTLGIAEESVQQLVAVFEAERPTTCPECGSELTAREWLGHLVTRHGYLDVDGSLLPRGAALSRLWERVLSGGENAAHQRLLQIYSASDGDKGYVAALESEFMKRAPSLADLRPALEPIVRCLRDSPIKDALIPRLVRAREAPVRELGRELLLPELAARARGGRLSATELRSQLDQALGDGNILEEKILLCLRLPQFGVSVDLANECAGRLQEERPVACSECRESVSLVDLETHLRQVHKIYEFRGVRRTYHDTRAKILDAVCGTSPDHAAWRMLEAIAHERHADDADKRLTQWIVQRLRGVERPARLAAAAALAEAVTASGSGARLLPRLSVPQKSVSVQTASRLLALEIATRLAAPVPRPILDLLHPLLGDRHVDRGARQRAVAALLRTTGSAGPDARALLMAYVAGSGKLRAIEKLQNLEQRTGASPAIDALCVYFEDRLRMNCPRCGVELPRARMVEHLWDQHRLVLEGRRVREPWRVIEDWIEDYRLERDAAVLERCRDLGRKLQGAEGLRGVQRLLLRHGVEDRDALAVFRADARAAGTTLCPHCYEQVPAPDTPAPPPLSLADDRLDGDGYHVELSETGLVPWLTIDSPRGAIYEGREPGRRLTRNGALVFVLVPFMAVAFLLMELVTAGALPPWLVLALAVGACLFVGGLVYLLWPASLNVRDRLVDLAWTELVPRLREEGLTVADLDFTAALADASVGLGRPAARAEPLERFHDALTQSARKKPELVPHLAALARLRIEDLARESEDPVAPLVAQVQLCFDGRLPLDYADRLVGGLPATFWSPSRRQRFAALACEGAFSAGLEPTDLGDLERAGPALGRAMDLEEAGTLAQRRLLWSLRGSRPWGRAGHARTAFELAADVELGSELLARFPDLLLAVRGLPIYVCSRGVWFADACITRLPRTFEVLARRAYDEPGFNLVIDSHRFNFAEHPGELADHVERWCRYYFRDFLPQASGFYTTRATDAVRRILARSGIACPGCRKLVIPRRGDVGLTLENKEENRSPWVTTEAVAAR